MTIADRVFRHRSAWTSAGLLLVIYLMTMSRGLTFFDSGELALVAAQYGLGHPPGQPGYTLALGLWNDLMPLSPVVNMTAFSALMAALCCFPADALMRTAQIHSHRVRFSCLLATGLMYPIWDQATRIELYSLMTFLVLSALASASELSTRGLPRPRDWLKMGLFVGLAVTVNPIHGLAAALGIGLFFIRGLVLAGVRRLAVATLSAICGSAIGLTPYLYILWVRGRTDRFVWGELSTLDGVYRYLTGQDYAHTAHSEWAKIPEHFGEWLVWSGREGFLLTLLIGLIGLAIYRPIRQNALLWIPVVAAGVAFTFSYGRYFPEVPDFSGYLVPAIWVAGVGIGGLATHISTKQSIALVLVALLSPVVFTGGRLVPDRSDNKVAIELAYSWLSSLPQNSILLAETDHLVFPAMYLQRVESVRPDVVLINMGFSASSWYWSQLFAQHPTLTKIPLSATHNMARLKRLLEHNAGRPVYAESGAIAAQLRKRPCVAQWGVNLTPGCTAQDKVDEQFNMSMQKWWSDSGPDDPIARKVLAYICNQRARTAYALGQVDRALRLLALSLLDERGQKPATPRGLNRIDIALQWERPEQLLGSRRQNGRIGHTILKHQNTRQFGAQAEVWKSAALELKD
ncbi:MAG: protein O-mannosyl-transferase family [Bradymonadia bacterium]